MYRTVLLASVLFATSWSAIAVYPSGEVDQDGGYIHVESPARDYDFFRNIRYPGQRRPEVGLDRIEQEGGPDAAGGYHKRVVHWWPKQGVDIVEVPEGAPLRTWTIRASVEPLVAVGTYAKWWPQTLRGKTEFKAHLLGFRGIGSETDHPFFPLAEERARGPGIAPAVVLRLEDGRKRTFTRGAFVDEDQAYLMDLYRQEMNRISATLEPAPTNVREVAERDFPNVAEPYEPGTIQVHTDHIVFLAGSEQPEGSWGEFFNREYKEKAEVFRNTFTSIAQDFWVYNEYAGRLMPYWEQDERYKYEILVGLTRVNGATDIGGGSGGGYGRCGVAGWVAFYHEWGHGQARNGMVLMGGGETHCDAHQTMADPTIVGKVEHQINRPWKNLFHGQYPGGLGYAMMGDDPHWGYAAAGTFTSLMTMEEHTPMHAIARLGEERGIWENGIKGMGDFMGQIGARFAEYDTELETGLREVFPAPNRAILVALDREKGLYRSTATEAPEPFGVNLIRLEAEPGTEKISVDFQGHFDAATHSDWRACIVAVDKDGRSRYSPLWNKGVMEMETRPGDQRYWLTVTATPYALTSPQPNGRMTVQHVYQGAFTYRYPYDVTLTGCRPATPNASFAFNENWELNRDPIWPVPSDSPEYPAARRRLEEVLARVPAVLAAIEEEGLYGDVLGYHINQKNRAINAANAVKRRAEWLLENAQGARHPNGGGWVAATAEVAPTAYVGPECMVLDGAKVLDHAAIEDYAVVSGSGVVVKDHAKVRGKAVVTGNVTISDFARVSRNLSGDTGQRTGVEQRQLFEVLNPILYANYAFDRPETVLMEDCFVEHSYGDFASGSHLETLIFFDGRLYGEPGFLADGDVRAVTFNGENQYAEADPAVADLGEITMDMAFHWDGGAATLLDFGSSADDRFMLTIAGNGELALSLIANGQRETLTAGAAIVSGEWTSCRIEMDGSTASLWINGERAASIETDFRAADAFKPGREMRNFVAASREREDFFAGAIEYLRIYHAVVDEFSQVGEPMMISSRRISEDFVERFQAQFADYEQQEKEFYAGLQEHPVYKYYRDYYRRVVERIAEMEASEEVEALEARLKEMEAGPERSLLQGEIRNLRRRNGLELNADEYKALVGFTGWQERQYTRPPPVERLKQRTLPFMPECRTQLYEALPIQKSEWHTTVDWDGRLEWEKADEPLSPIMVRWIQRMKPYASQQ